MPVWDPVIAASVCVGVLGLTVLAWIFSQSKGIEYWRRYLIILLHIILHKRSIHKRLSNYNKIKSPDASPEDLGLIPSPSEYMFEQPQKENKLQVCDGVHFFGVDVEANHLEVCINKISENQATVWLILKLSDETVFQLPLQPDTRAVYIENEQGFNACGLQIRCLSPLRRWRVSFNGLMRKSSSTEKAESDKEELIHVKFSFIWTAISLVHDHSVEYEVSELAKAFAAGQEKVSDQDLSYFQEVQNRYEQWGQLMGTVHVQGQDEKELYLWSLRSRILDKPIWDSDIYFVKLYIYFKEGTPLKIEAVSIQDFISNYINGYSITAGGKKEPITNCNLNIDQFKKENLPSRMKISFQKSGKQNLIEVECTGEKIELLVGPRHERIILIQPLKVLMGEEEGFGIMQLGYRSERTPADPCKMPIVILKDKGHSSDRNKLVLLLSEESCQSSQVSGGKGCSLSLLTQLSKHTGKFTVPEGFIVTTAAFEQHVKANKNLSDAIKRLKDVSCERIEGDLKTECEICAEEFSSTDLSEFLKYEIESNVSAQFQSPDSIKFAIRSSACGEDSEDLSAAGQMLTLLGVKGFDNIYEAVSKCWSSHFRFEAVQYSRQNGQPVDSGMAVVIQEMVPANVAGVMFTVDPVTGNPAYPCITANFGLGETVVSSAAEPDTITLKREFNGIISVHEQNIGSKIVQVVMKDDGGVEQHILPEDSKIPCLSNEWAMKIGNIGLLVEQCYCGPRDIEWALCGDRLFLLQARPVTTLYTETEFELTHELDDPIKSASEFWTRANTGEVFLGATSPLGISLVVHGMDIYGHRTFIVRQKPAHFDYVPYHNHWLPVTHRQVTLSMIDTIFRTNEKTISATQKAFEIGLFGRVVGTEEMHRIGVKRHGYLTKKMKFLSMFGLTLFSFKLPNMIKTFAERVSNFSVPIDSYTTPSKTYDGICKQMKFYGELSGIHGLATYLSSVYNVMMISTLARGKNDWDNELYSDFATLLSTCTGVESADVPSSLQELAKAIAETDAVTFSSVPVEVAYSLLKNDTGTAGKKFNEFMLKHGHRCVSEFDVYAVSWRMKPQSLIAILQNMVKSSSVINSKSKETTSVDAAIEKLKSRMSSNLKRFLKILLPWARTAVGQREKTKSLIIKIVDWLRQSCYHLGKLLVLEGLLPDKELIFFLAFDEIKELVEKTHSPGLISKAIRRRRLHPKLNSLQFPEIMVGIPKPIKEETENLYQCLPSFELKGTPVCQGIVKARARVILKLEEASTIQSGDILVTHSTDIGWSPYFPLLSGVVTVLGGLISHGAVVAREYGLPCVVGVQKATFKLKSGDLIILDGIKGTITKIDESSELPETV